MLRSLRVVLAPAVVLAAIIPITTMAAGMSLHLSRATLHAKIEISLNMVINCPTPSAGDYITQEEWGVNFEQAAGTGIASGNYQNFVSYPSPMPWQCTSANVRLPVTVLADLTGRPFHDGQAIVTAQVSVAYASGTTVSASVGPKTVWLGG